MVRPNREPRSKIWGVVIKQLANRLSLALIGRTIFALSIYELFGTPPSWQAALSRWWGHVVRTTNLYAAFGLLIFISLAAWAWSRIEPDSHLWPHLAGVAMEVFFVLIIFALFESYRLVDEGNHRQHEIIDDFKRWDSIEARYRIAGAARRLNRAGISKMDFSGLRLSNFDFAKAGVNDLQHSIFYDGTWGERFGDARVELNAVEFNHVNCREVVFSAMNPLNGLGLLSIKFAIFTDCSFIECPLRGSIFNGAELTWSKLPPAEIYEEYESSDGQLSRSQILYGPFYNADLTWASFRGTRFSNADFRGAEGLEDADFFEAVGLEDAYFDNEGVRQIVLNSVRRDRLALGYTRDLRSRRAAN